MTQLDLLQKIHQAHAVHSEMEESTTAWNDIEAALCDAIYGATRMAKEAGYSREDIEEASLVEPERDEPEDVAYYYAGGLPCCDSTGVCAMHHNVFAARDERLRAQND